MKSILTVLLLNIWPSAFAQVTIQPIVPAVGIMQKAQLWNIVIVNSSGLQYSCRLQLILKDRFTNLEILNAATNIFPISMGTKQLTASSLNPIQYNYLAQGFNIGLQELIPVGSYTACYNLTSVGDKEIDLANECVAFDVEALSPPMLVNPADSSLLDVSPSQFLWIPPAPAEMFSRLRYDVNITALNEGQQTNEAIQENVPFYSEGNHLSNILNYGATLPAFEKDKWYAWQITARDDRSYAGKSALWIFKIKPDTVAKPQPGNDNYILIGNNTQTQSINAVSQHKLFVKYYSFYSAQEVTVKFFDSGGRQVYTVKQKVTYGDNYLDFKLNNSFKAGQVYTILITDNQQHSYSALFNIQ